MKLQLDVDSAAVLKMLNKLGNVAEARLLAAAEVTGQRIADEARARFSRQTAGTGKTAAAITSQATADRKGVRVFVGRTSHPAGLPGWIEFGTRYMRARPFLFNSARLEEAPHMRRVKDALDDAVKEAGGS